MDKPLHIGVYGGTFDPVHKTHLDIARAALVSARLDTILFVVAACPPHKRNDVFASAEDRLELVRLAIAEEPAMEASRIEIDRQGTSYTVDTLFELKRQYPDAELFLIVGYDSLLDLPKWRNPQGVLSNAHLLAIPRAGVVQTPPESLQNNYDLLPFEESTVSSTEIRHKIAAGETVSELLPPAVERLIHERGLYHASCAPREV